MQSQVIRAKEELAPSATLELTLIDGAALYAADFFGKGYYLPPLYATYSEGLSYDNPTNPPDWGDFEMCSDGVVGVNYDCQWDLIGIYSPTTFSLLTGSLPGGLSLESVAGNLGRIYGTPTAAGTFNFTLRATNDYGTSDQAFSITIVSAPGGGGGAFTFIG